MDLKRANETTWLRLKTIKLDILKTCSKASYILDDGTLCPGMGVTWAIPNMEDKSSLSPFQQVRQGLGLTVVLHIGMSQVSSVPEWNSNLPTPDRVVPYLHREVEDQPW
jgi:hypothetical protein